MIKFIISQRSNGEYQFNLVTQNGQIILGSEAYSSKAACENGIESVRKNAKDVLKFDKKISSNGMFYFNLKAGNGQIIGSSQMYDNEIRRDNGIESIAINVEQALIEDRT